MTELAELGLKVDSEGFVKATRRMKDYEKQGKRVESATDRMIRKADKLGETMGKAGRAMSVGITAPLTLLAGAGIRAFSRFDAAMTKSLAIMGDVEEAMRVDMANSARQMAKETTFSAEQAAESYFFLASAGLDAEQSIAALPQVARFAQAGMFDMARATDLATDSQSALGLTVDDSVENLANLTRVTDVLVKANTIANASVEQFAESLTNRAGAAMRQLNIEVETGVAVLAAWADQGEKGLRSGERFNIVTRDLQTAARKNREEFDKLNITVFDSQGAFANMGEIVEDLEEALEGMSVEQQGATLKVLGFQDRSVQAIRSLLGFSDAIKEYERQLRGAAGTTEEIAENQLTSFSNQLGLLGSRLNDVLITIGEGLAPVIQDLMRDTDGVVARIENVAAAFAKMDAESKKLVITMGVILAAIGPVLIVLGAVVRSLQTLLPLLRRAGPIALGIKVGTDAYRAFGMVIDDVRENYAAAADEAERFQGVIERGEFQIPTETPQRRVREIETFDADQTQAEIEKLERLLRRFRIQGVDMTSDAVVRMRHELDLLNTRAEALDKVVEDTGETVAGVVPEVEGAAEATKAWRGFVRDLEAELGGPMAEALNDFLAEAELVREDLEAGRIEGDLYADVMRVLRERFLATRAAIKADELEEFNTELERAADRQRAFVEENERLAATLSGTAAVAELDFKRGIEDAMAALAAGDATLIGFIERLHLLGIQFEQSGDAGTGFLSSIGSGFAQSVFNGQGVRSSLASALTGAGGQGIADALDSTDMAEFFKTAFKDGIGAAFEDSEFQKNSAAGYAMALGQAMEGNYGQAALTAIGSIWGPIGAAIGSMVGGMLFDESVPKFQARGTRATQATDAGTDLVLDTDFGDFELAFRGLSDAQKQAVEEGYTSFFNFVGDLTANLAADQQQRIADAVQEFGISSRSGPDSPEAQMKLLLSDIAATFPPFFSEMVENEATLDDQLAKFADLLALDDRLAVGGGLAGMTFEQLARFLDDAGQAGESLVQTLDRVEVGFDALTRVGDLTGVAVRGTAEELAQLSADLTRLFGAQEFGGMMNRILEAAFSDEELAQQTIDAARQRATDLLTGLGIAVTEDTFTAQGLQDLLTNFAGAFGPEQTAQLVSAMDAIASLIAAEESLADTTEEVAEEIAGLSDASISILETLAPARLEFMRLTQSIEEMRSAEEDLGVARLAAELQIQGFIQGLRRSLPGLIQRFNGAGDAAETATNQIERGVRNTRDAWLNAIDNIQQALDGQLVGQNSSLTNEERLNELESQLTAAAQAAIGGDLEAAQQIPALFREIMSQGADFYGTSTDNFAEFEARMRDIVGAVPLNATIPPEVSTAQNTADIAQSNEQIELTAFEQFQAALQIVDMIGLLAGLTEETAAEIAIANNADIVELIRVLTGEVPDLTGDALEEYFNELVASTGAQLSEFARLEMIGVEHLELTNQSNLWLEDIFEILNGDDPTGDKTDPPDQGIIPVEDPIGGPFTLTPVLPGDDGGGVTPPDEPPILPGPLPPPDDGSGGGVLPPFDGGGGGGGIGDELIDKFDTGGPVKNTGPALVHAGEHVIPRGGSLVSRDPALIAEVRELRDVVRAGNRDRRDGFGVTIETLRNMVRVEIEKERVMRSEVARGTSTRNRTLGVNA